MMRRGVRMPEVERVVRRQRDAKPAKRADRAVTPVKPVFPEPGAIELLFKEARRIR